MSEAEKGPTYTSQYVIIGVTCTGCKQALLSQGNIPAVLEIEQLHTIAKAVHDSNGLVCPDPKFVIGFVEQLIDTRLLEQPPIEVVPAGKF